MQLPLVKQTIDFATALNAEQYAVVTQGEGPCLVLAGAGSGKTRTLVYRVAYLLERGEQPASILLVTFTNKAAKEMLHRITQLLGGECDIWGGTFHHIGNKILRTYGQHIGIESNYAILDEDDSKSLLKSCLHEVMPNADKYFPKADLIQSIISLHVNIGDPIRKIVLERYPYFDETVIGKLERILVLYVERKRAMNALDYDDLLSQWLRLLQDVPAVATELSERFRYILVDEYQDTNHIQSQIIALMARIHRNVLVVGDDAQSIYSFRGANVQNILSFPKVFSNTKTFRLVTNYRSTPEILNLANASIAFNRGQFKKELVTHKASGVRPKCIAFDDQRKQAEYVCQKIVQWRDDSTYAPNDIGILFRSHFQSLELELELNRQGISYDLRGGVRFFEQSHIKDVLAYVRVFANVADEVAWNRLLRLQPGIGPAAAIKALEVITKASSMSAVMTLDLQDVLSKRAAASWFGLRNLLVRLAELDDTMIAKAIETVVTSSYAAYMINTFDNAIERIDDLRQMVTFAMSYTSRDAFLADTVLAENFRGQKQKGKHADSVTLSTIHQAKGLEWRVVFIIGLTDGQFPNGKVYADPQQLEEERRLFYVATTRAQERLYMLHPLFNRATGSIGKMSPFIAELPSGLYSFVDTHLADQLRTGRRPVPASGDVTYDYTPF